MGKRGLSFLPTFLRAEEVKAYEKDAKSNMGHNLLLDAKTSHLNNVASIWILGLGVYDLSHPHSFLWGRFTLLY